MGTSDVGRSAVAAAGGLLPIALDVEDTNPADATRQDNLQRTTPAIFTPGAASLNQPRQRQISLPLQAPASASGMGSATGNGRAIGARSW